MTLIQTKKIKKFPLIFVGVDYWEPLFDFLEGRLLKQGAIAQDDFDRLVLTDSIDEVREALTECPSAEPGAVKPGKPLRWPKEPTTR